MHKTDFIDAVAKKAQQKKEITRRIIESALEVIAENAQRHEPLVLTGFGSFVIKNRGPKTVTDFKTKKKRKLPASKAFVFRASPKIKELVNGQDSEISEPASSSEAKAESAKKE